MPLGLCFAGSASVFTGTSLNTVRVPRKLKIARCGNFHLSV